MGLFNLLKKKKDEYTNTPIKEKQIESKPTLIPDFDIPNLTFLKASSYKSANGLYPHEILMLSYATKFKLLDNDFQRFWLYRYGVRKPEKILEKLYGENFIEPCNLEQVLEKQTVAVLKNELKCINEKVTGTKKVLVQRLLENGDLEGLEKKYSNRFYSLTDKGQQELTENEYVLYLHRKSYMDIWEMNKMIYESKSNPKQYRDILWKYFNSKSLEYSKNCEFGIYRLIRYNMYSFVLEENLYEQAFLLLSEVVYYDISGLGNSDISWIKGGNFEYKFFLKLLLQSAFPYESSIFRIPPLIIKDLLNLKKLLNLNEKEFEEKLISNLKKFALPFHMFTLDESVEIIINEMNQDKEKVELIYNKAEERIKKEYNSIK